MKGYKAFVLHQPKLPASSAGGTGNVALMLALSVCARTDIYGFATEPGKEHSAADTLSRRVS